MELRSRHEAEIEHGSRIAASAEETWGWGSPAGKKRARRRAALLLERAGARPGLRLLELGCGVGVFTELFLLAGAEIVGVDISHDLLRRGRERCGASARVSLERACGEALPHPAASFDAVLGSSILHHLEVRSALREVFRVLKPGGRVAFAEPNMMNPQVFVTKNVPAIKRWAGDTPGETAFFRWEVARALRRAGFTEVRVEPFDFLHPSCPESMIRHASRIGRALEALPVFREFAGSLIISAARPSCSTG